MTADSTGADQVGPLLLEARDVAKRFGAVVALRAATLRVRRGEVHALMGANGAGKSTLVKMLTGVLRPDGGTILVRGKPCQFRSPAEARGVGLISLYQDPALVPDLSIAQNLRLAGAPIEAVRPWLRQFGLDRIDLRSIVRELPLPMLRLIDLARALAAEPEILLLDELTAALPADLAAHVYDVARDWRERGRSVIFISHRLTEIAAVCDRATVLRDGVTVGVVEPARGGEEEIVALMLGGSAPSAEAHLAKITFPPASAGGDGATVALGTNCDSPAIDQAPRAATAKRSAHGGRSVLTTEHLACGERLIDVSFALHAGEVLGIAALEGQGQEELFDCLAGLRRPDAGTITAHGRSQRFRHPGDAIQAGLVLVPADRLQALLPQRSVRENVALPLVRGLRAWGLLPMRAEQARVADAVKRLQIDTRAGSELRRLSGGNQQKVAIARWLACGFAALLCFDPTRGIDIGTKRQIYTLVRELADAGAAVLLFTSELPEIALACDRVLVLFGGRIVGEMPAADADEATLLRAAHGLAPQIEAVA